MVLSLVGFKRIVDVPFQVRANFEGENFSWDGKVTWVMYHGSHMEFEVQSSSNFIAVAGRYSSGVFLSIPRFGVGLALAQPDDTIHGLNKILESKINCIADSITAVHALKALYEAGMFTGNA